MFFFFKPRGGNTELRERLRAISRGVASVVDIAPYGPATENDPPREDFEALASDWNEVRQDFLIELERQDARNRRRQAA